MISDEELRQMEHDAALSVDKNKGAINEQWRRHFAALILERAAAECRKVRDTWKKAEPAGSNSAQAALTCEQMIKALKTEGDIDATYMPPSKPVAVEGPK